MKNAIFCKGAYLLLPEAFPTFQSFMEDLRSKSLPAEYNMVVLRENHHMRSFSVFKGISMAPYFLSGYHDEPSRIVIGDVSDIYPVSVEILSQEEYNIRLREVVNRVCPGCVKFKPLSNRVQSLNGHFEEVSLDGTCLFRQETKPSPRSFHDHLFSFGGFFLRCRYFELNAQEFTDKIKQWFYVRHDAPVLEEGADRKTLTLTCKKKELLTSVITEAISRYLDCISEDTYHIRQANRPDFTQSYLDDLLGQADSETFRKECKRAGIALAVLEYDPHGADVVRNALEPLVDHFWMFPLAQAPGKEYYLIAETSYVLKELRYRSPLMQAYNAAILISDQYKSSRFQITFQMPRL